MHVNVRRNIPKDNQHYADYKLYLNFVFSQHFGKTNAAGNPLNLIFILSEDFFKRVRKFA